MELLASDIQTKEVLDWKGIHLIHFQHSSCSQKTRIFLNLKGIEWQSHELNLAKQSNYEDWFLGINPRGLVPVLNHDGAVHIESNDILAYLEQTFTQRVLIPEGSSDEIEKGLQEEDELHLAIRAITMRFLSPRSLVKKKASALSNYKNSDATVRGEVDSHKDRELKFWSDFNDHGVTDAQALEAVTKFYLVYERYEQVLATQRYLAGPELSLLDIAWFIYTYRLFLAGYPFQSLHPHVFLWYDALMQWPEFLKEVSSPIVMTIAVDVLKFSHRVRRQALEDVMRRGGLLS